MPTTALKHLAKRAKISLDRAEHLWAKSKEIVDAEYPYDTKDQRYWALRMGVTKKMMGLSEHVSFSEFLRLHEAAAGPEPEYSEVDIDTAVEFVKTHCKDSIRWIKKGIGFWRGDDKAKIYKHGFAIVDTSATTRKSQNTSNHYTVLMDSNPYMENFPKRSKSFIATTNDDYARRFRNLRATEVMMVVPIDGAEIGFVPADDIWEIDPIDIFGGQFSLTSLNFEFREMGINDNIESFNKFDRRLKFGDDIAIRALKNTFSGISDNDVKNFLDTIYKAFATAGFTTYTTATVPEAVLRDDREVWIGAKCICISKKMLEEIKERL